MTLHEDGVWEAITKVEQEDLFYSYEIEHSIGNGPTNTFKKDFDPYAKGSLSREGPGLIRKSQNKPTQEANSVVSGSRAQRPCHYGGTHS